MTIRCLFDANEISLELKRGGGNSSSVEEKLCTNTERYEMSFYPTLAGSDHNLVKRK